MCGTWCSARPRSTAPRAGAHHRGQSAGPNPTAPPNCSPNASCAHRGDPRHRGLLRPTPSAPIPADRRGPQVPNNPFLYIAQVAAGRRERLDVFGDDYDTPTARACATTCVVDLAQATWRHGPYRRRRRFPGHNLARRGTSVLRVCALEGPSGPSRTRWSIGARATSPCASPTPPQPPATWDGPFARRTTRAVTWRWQSSTPVVAVETDRPRPRAGTGAECSGAVNRRRSPH